MIYDSLDTIPYKTFIKIAETGNVFLLSHDIKDEELLKETWSKIHQEHMNLNPTDTGKKVFRLSKDIAVLEALHTAVLMAVEALKFDWHEDLVEFLHYHQYTLRNTNTKVYYDDLNRIERETKALVIKANNLKKMLPKEEANGNYDIDNVMASYSLILGFDFDYNIISYTKFFALQKSVHAKIKSIESQNIKKNGK